MQLLQVELTLNFSFCHLTYSHHASFVFHQSPVKVCTGLAGFMIIKLLSLIDRP